MLARNREAQSLGEKPWDWRLLPEIFQINLFFNRINASSDKITYTVSFLCHQHVTVYVALSCYYRNGNVSRNAARAPWSYTGVIGFRGQFVSKWSTVEDSVED